MTTEEVRRRWPEVLEALRASHVTWSLVSANAQVAELARDVLYLAFPSPGLARTFSSSRHTSAVQDVVYQTLGLQLRVEARLAEDGPAGGSPGPARPAGSPGSGPGADRGAAPAPAAGPAGGESEGPASGAPVAVTPVSMTAGPVEAPTAAVPSRPVASAVPGGGTVPDGGAAHAGPSAPAARASSAEPGANVPSGAVALQERPVLVEPVPVAVVDVADEAWLAGTPTPPPAPRASTADDAWLSGAPAPEPPDDLDDGPEPEPVLEHTPQRQPSPATPAPQRQPSPAASTPQPAAARPVPARPSGAPALRGASAARAAIAAATSARASRPAEEPVRQPAATTVDPMDDIAADDDVDITSSGLVGTALVVSLLGGKIVEEIQDPGL